MTGRMLGDVVGCWEMLYSTWLGNSDEELVA